MAMDIVTLLIVWLVTAVSLWIISKLPLGVEIDTPEKAIFSAAVLGIITALVKPVLKVWLVDGFRLRYGIWSAVLGAFALTLINNIIYKLLGV
jgi:putative membrane protein